MVTAVRLDINEIKTRFPNPQRCQDDGLPNPVGYCVGGAFLMYLTGVQESPDGNTRYPIEEHLVPALQNANPTLSEERAEILVVELLTENDNGNFDRAWEILEELLYSDFSDAA